MNEKNKHFHHGKCSVVVHKFFDSSLVLDLTSIREGKSFLIYSLSHHKKVAFFCRYFYVDHDKSNTCRTC